MKHASNPRRGRGRSSGKRNQSSRNRNFESNSSEAKVRGTPQQILDKYQALARDASLAGDRIAAEGFYQHAEHYYRVLNPEGAQNKNQHERNPRHDHSANQRGESGQRSEQRPNVKPEINEASSVPVVEATEEVTPEPMVEQPAEEKAEAVETKPRRRSRPRKATAKEPVSKDENASETAA